MLRKRLYAEISDDLLGAFYIYIQKNIKKGINVELMNKEIEMIKKESSFRNIPIIKLKECGLSLIEKERQLVSKHL